MCKFFDPGAKRATVMGYVVMERQVCISFLDQGAAPPGPPLWKEEFFFFNKIMDLASPPMNFVAKTTRIAVFSVRAPQFLTLI